MHTILANPALDLPTSDRCGRVARAARWGARLLGLAAQGALFGAVLWLLVAGPGFLFARDSLMPEQAVQASR